MTDPLTPEELREARETVEAFGMTDPADTALASLICERNDHPDAPACDGCYAMAAWLREHGYALRDQIRAAVEGLPLVECVDLECSHDDLSFSQREHPWLERAAVLAIIEPEP